jgi:NADH:ubiquinone oxidoreductase subunit 5 (subunit L)/multisubunit Na+/H+ antiporter MnhA subunit
LLFLNAGAFELATGERDLNRLGGLAPILPLTAFTAVVASASIAGLPPTNGFSSKWLLYHASLWGSGGPRVVFVFFGIVALFVSAITLALFLQFLGSTIWGAPSPAVRRAIPRREMPWVGPGQLVLAAGCVALGIFPVAGAWPCYVVGASIWPGLFPGGFASLFGKGHLAMQVLDGGVVVGAWAPLVVALILAAPFAVGIGIRRSAGAATRRSTTWTCGSEVDGDQLRFKASHYYTPLKALARRLSWGGRGLPLPTRERYWPGREKVTSVLNPDTWGIYPAVGALLSGVRTLSTSKAGLPQVYPAWNLIGLALSFIFLLLLWRW